MRLAFFALCFGLGVFHAEIRFGHRTATWRAPRAALENATDVFFTGDAGRLGATRARPPYDDEACLGPPKFLLYLHDAHETRAHPAVRRRAAALRAPPFCYEVTALDYRGFGDSGGVPDSVAGLAADARVVFRSLRERAPAGVGAVVVYARGRLGAAVALALARRACRRPDPRLAPPTALLLEAAYDARVRPGALDGCSEARIFQFHGGGSPTLALGRALAARIAARPAPASFLVTPGAGDAAFDAALPAVGAFLAAGAPAGGGSCPG